MARGFGATSGVSTTDSVVTTLLSIGTTRTYFVRFKRDGTTGSVFPRLFHKGGSDLFLFLDDAADIITWSVLFSTQSGTWTIPYTRDTAWHTVGVSYDSSAAANDPIIYLDGTPGTLTEVVEPVGTALDNGDAFQLGNRTSDNLRVLNGNLAEWAVWNALLTADESVALATHSPLLVRPTALVDYVPLVSSVHSYVRAGALTVTGTAVQDHPRVISPRRQTIFLPAAAAAGNTIAVPAGALTLTAFAPAVVQSGLIAVPVAALTLTGFAPAVVASDHKTVVVPVAALTLTGQVPAVSNGVDPLVDVARAVLINADTGAVIWSKDPDTTQAQASTTKWMTALLAAEHGTMATSVTVDSALFPDPLGSNAGLVNGESLTLENLVRALMLPSGNDAANIVADHIGDILSVGGGIARFITEMNTKAGTLGLTNTAFVNAHGQDASGHYTSARDLAALTKAALDNATLLALLSGARQHYIASPVEHLWDSNVGTMSYAGWVAGKGGSTETVLASTALVERGGVRLIGVVMQSVSEPDTRQADIREMFDYGLRLESISAEATATITEAYSLLTNNGFTRSGYFPASYFDGFAYTSATTGHYIEYAFVGSKIQWYGIKSSDRGHAAVSIDAVLDQTVNNYSATAVPFALCYEKTFSVPGAHTIRVELPGTKDAASSGFTVDVDRFVTNDNLTGFDTAIAAPAAALTLAGFAPTVAVSDNKSVAVPAAALTLTGLAPTVAISDHKTVSSPAAALTLTGFAPTVLNGANIVVDVPIAALVLAGLAPTVTATAHNVIAVPLGALTLTAYAPTVQNGANIVVDVPAAALALTGFAPQIVVTANNTVAVPLGTLTLTGYAPTVTASEHQIIQVPAGTLLLTGFAPSVTIGSASTIVAVPLATLTLTGYPPVVVSDVTTPVNLSGARTFVVYGNRTFLVS